MIACQVGHLEVLQLLFDHGAVFEANNDQGRKSLILASQEGHLEVVKLFFDQALHCLTVK